MKIGERVFVQCECGGPSHIMKFELGGSVDEPELTVWYMLNPRLPLHKRIVTAALYVLGRASWRTAQWLDFDEFCLNHEAVEKVKDACDTFLEMWQARVSKKEARDKIIEMCRYAVKVDKLAGAWAELLSAKLGRPAKEIEEHGLLAGDFPDVPVRVSFEDGALVVAKDDEVAVFTKHCGYHVFPRSIVSEVFKVKTP